MVVDFNPRIYPPGHNEKLEDLKAVCRWHHTLIHGRKF